MTRGVSLVEKLLELQTGSSEKQPELVPGRTRLDDQRDGISKESAEKHSVGEV